MKKKIIIISHTMRMGGVERSLIGLLNSFDYANYAVDLFLFLQDGEFMPLIPKEVHLLPENKKYAGLLQPIRYNMRQGNFKVLLGKLKARKKAKRFIQKNKLKAQNLVYDNYLQKYTLPYLPKISHQEYDLAISFLTPHYVAAKKVNAKKRVAWIHTDYAFFDLDKQSEVAMWSAYDAIASVSEACTQGFIKQFPALAAKMILIENILQVPWIREQAKAFSVEEEMPKVAGNYRLLSVGRFSHPKNFDNIPAICKKINQAGVAVIWYLIGYGSDEDLIRQKIAEADMAEKVIILGKKENPYPYMQACDLYVQPSRYEGKAVTVREAQILGKPVIITAFPTAESQLKNGFDGIIVPLNKEDCANGMITLLHNPDLREQLIQNCLASDFSNKQEVQKMDDLLSISGKA